MRDRRRRSDVGNRLCLWRRCSAERDRRGHRLVDDIQVVLQRKVIDVWRVSPVRGGAVTAALCLVLALGSTACSEGSGRPSAARRSGVSSARPAGRGPAQAAPPPSPPSPGALLPTTTTTSAQLADAVSRTAVSERALPDAYVFSNPPVSPASRVALHGQDEAGSWRLYISDESRSPSFEFRYNSNDGAGLVRCVDFAMPIDACATTAGSLGRAWIGQVQPEAAKVIAVGTQGERYEAQRLGSDGRYDDRRFFVTFVPTSADIGEIDSLTESGVVLARHRTKQ